MASRDAILIVLQVAILLTIGAKYRYVIVLFRKILDDAIIISSLLSRFYTTTQPYLH